MDNEITAIVAGMRAAADWLERNSDIKEPYDPKLQFFFVTDTDRPRQQVADLARRMGTCKKDATSELFSVVKMFGPFKVEGIAYRDNVCERIVTGTEKVTVPAVEARPEREEVRELVEWKCSPLTAVEFTDERLLEAPKPLALSAMEEAVEVPF